MGISIKNSQTEDLARELARETGESLTQAIRHAVEERLVRLRGRRTADLRLQTVEGILRQLDELPDLDTRRAEEILGYGEHGV